MHRVERVLQARDVVQIQQRCLAEAVGVGVEDLDGSAAAAKVDPRPGDVEIVLGISPADHKVAPGAGDTVLDQAPREAEPPGLGQPAPGGDDALAPGVRGAGQADLLQQVQRGGVDALHVALGQRLVAAAHHARPDGCGGAPTLESSLPRTCPCRITYHLVPLPTTASPLDPAIDSARDRVGRRGRPTIWKCSNAR